MEHYAFSAMLARMKYISRWGLMRSTRTESLSEHTAEAALLAHLLALIAVEEYGEAGIRPETVAVAALYHDAGEILTGDMPTPVKYKNDRLKTAYKAVERESAESLARLLPNSLRNQVGPYICGDKLGDAENKLLKAADCLCALIKCIEEENSGNTEFRSAKTQQYERLQAMNLPAANYFLEHMLPCYQQDLDELSRGIL